MDGRSPNFITPIPYLFLKNSFKTEKYSALKSSVKLCINFAVSILDTSSSFASLGSSLSVSIFLKMFSFILIAYHRF